MSNSDTVPADPRVDSRSDARIGTLLRGKYRLDRVIGAGGMAVVYKATHRNHAEFAVKMLHPTLSVREDIRSRFIREGYAANAVKHPGVVLVVDDDVADDGAAFLVMELLDGLSGDRLSSVGGKRVSVELASAIAIQLLDVLAAAHERGIIHRDIKPANFFATRAGVVKVLDFGIARTREAVFGQQTTATGLALGTPAFMAPEHARGRTREIDGRTDLWAVGATLFSMVSAQLVHEAETPNEFLIAAGTRPARSLLAALPDAPPAIAAIVDRALAFEKRERWQSAADMRDALADAHVKAFGARDPLAVIAEAVKADAPAPAPAPYLISPAAETRTFPPVSSAPPVSRPTAPIDESAPRVPTVRLSTSAATWQDRDAKAPWTSRWAIGAGGAAASLLALGIGAWLVTHRIDATASDGGAREKMVAAGRDGMIDADGDNASILRGHPVIVPSSPLEAPPVPTVVTAPPLATLATKDANVPLPSTMPSSAPNHRASPLRHGAPDAGAGAASSCTPPWFFDSAGHKQYKPECL